MTTIRCASSQLMTSLLTWRNPEGREEHWMLAAQEINNPPRHLAKLIAAETGIALLTISSAVETVAYSVLTLASLALYPITDRPYEFFARLLESSSFTIIWGLANAVLLNPVFRNVATHESFARLFAHVLNPTRIVIFRENDTSYLAAWAIQHHPRLFEQFVQGGWNNLLMEPIFAQERGSPELIDQGASLIQQDVLANANDKTIELFMEMDPSIFMFVLTKSAYIYTFGNRKNDTIPNFLKQSTKDLILSLRQKSLPPETSAELQRLFADPDAFNTPEQGIEAQSIFNRLRNIGSEELQNSLLTTRCWARAIEKLQLQGC